MFLAEHETKILDSEERESGMTTYGSLFSGYGGLDIAARNVFGSGELLFVSDVEAGPNKVLQERYPNVPNIGDITQVDWSVVPYVDVLTGGSPCQDLSIAGQRAGMKPGTRSGLWESMAKAIKELRPKYVVWENVRGALSASAYSDLGWTEGLLDGRTPVQYPKKEDRALRALGRVLGDLTNLGYDARWATVRASDIGAPHRRERVFVVAYPHGSGWEGLGHWASQTPPGRHGHTLTCVGDDLGQLLPTPTTVDAAADGPSNGRRDTFGPYADAIARWEAATGREAPEPTVRAKTGKPQLSAKFVEFLMGLPDGWVTDISISRTAQLRALGNGVVPQQAEFALRKMLH